MIRMLVVEDDPDLRGEILDELSSRIEGLELRSAGSVQDALQVLGEWLPQVLLVDLGLPERGGDEEVQPLGGGEVIATVEELLPGAVVVVLSGADRDTAVQLLLEHRGVADYLFKDTPWPEAAARIQRHVDDARRRQALREAQGMQLVGSSSALAALRSEISLVAPQETPVLILGESGTGKELVARQVHAQSRRQLGPFVAQNCAALTESLVESELFGHVRGAFTGADRDRAGRFEAARGGTLFLDEIGDLPSGTQAKLLRVLEDRTYHPVGCDEPLVADFRLVAATNRELERIDGEAAFRQDLYYRLAVFPLRTTPLRERREDLPELVAHFVATLGVRPGGKPGELSPEALQALQGHDWPGNVRELRNTVERLLILSRGEVVTGDLVRRVLGVVPADEYRVEVPATGADYHEAKQKVLEAFHREFLTRALIRNQGNILRTSEEIGYNRRNLSETLRELGIDPGDYRGS